MYEFIISFYLIMNFYFSFGVKFMSSIGMYIILRLSGFTNECKYLGKQTKTRKLNNNCV